MGELEQLLVLVAEGPGEGLLGGLTQSDGQDVVDLLEEFLLFLAQVLDRVALGGHAAQDDGIVTQLGEDESVEASSVGGAIGLGVDGLWNDSVALDEVDEHVPLATVADGFLEQMLDHAVVDVLVAQVDDALEEPWEGRRSK